MVDTNKQNMDISEYKLPSIENISTTILNAALDMSLEWGENLHKPINERIIKKFPELNEDQANSLNLWCDEVKNYAFSQIEKEYPAGETAIERVKDRYPQLDNGNLTRLLSQGMYYAWHG